MKLRGYLHRHNRLLSLPVLYDDLCRFSDLTTLYDKGGQDTLWDTAVYSASDRRDIYSALVRTYAALKVMGDMSLIEHLITDRVDVCTWGNTRPYRVRILNTLNENFDYFYVKRADASRIYGLELEHLLSPNRIEFQCRGDTVVEEHIAGIPGDDFIANYLGGSRFDAVRLAKEFVKFNERCFVRLLGDMHSGNYVVDITPDFDETSYRIRAIDFDQQSYEGRRQVYLPQYYRANNPIVALAMGCMTPETFLQYRHEERTLMARRAHVEKKRLDALLRVMSNDDLAPSANIYRLRGQLAEHYRDQRFATCESMGDLVRVSLRLVSAGR